MDQDKEIGASRGSDSEYSEVEVYAFSIEEALKSAADAMKTSIVNLEYEILERGSGGFLGFGKKPHRILVKMSEHVSLDGEFIKSGDDDMPFEEIVVNPNQDGRFKVFVTREGVFLRVDAPKGTGKYAQFQDIQNHLNSRDITKYNENSVKREAENPSGKNVKIGDYFPSSFDSRFQLQTFPDEMKVFVSFTKPERYGRVVDSDEVMAALKQKSIIFGIKTNAVSEAIENELFNMPIMIAEGDTPIEGKDAQLKYHFKTDKDDVKFEVGADGNVDFHKLDIVQSVVVGQVLATKVPPEKGRAGKTTTGRVIPARDGKDLKITAGPNTHLSPDGLQIIADINGQVFFKNNRIQVDPVFEVSGDVDLNTGDINFPGNVIIYGNVNDTFKVYSGANIEIKGNIGKASVVAEGNIIVRQGIQGKDEANVVCAGDLYAKFIERAKIKADGYVIVSEAILHSQVDCRKKVLVHGGKRSQIAGGRVRALYEINAKLLGADSYTETQIEAGIDPTAENRISEIIKRKDEINKEWPMIKQEVANLTMMLGRGLMPPDKQNQFNMLTMKNNEFKQEMDSMDDQLRQLQEYLEGLGKDAKISCSKTVYPGVKIKIKSEILLVKNDYKFVTFFREGGNIKIAPYEKAKEMEDKVKEPVSKKKDR
jgi:uncharacterized protein